MKRHLQNCDVRETKRSSVGSVPRRQRQGGGVNTWLDEWPPNWEGLQWGRWRPFVASSGVFYWFLLILLSSAWWYVASKIKSSLFVWHENRTCYLFHLFLNFCLSSISLSQNVRPNLWLLAMTAAAPATPHHTGAQFKHIKPSATLAPPPPTTTPPFPPPRIRFTG